MVKQIDLANRKGGTGKSEDALHLAVYISRYKHKKVLLIDEDGSNCTVSTQLIKMENDPMLMEGFRPFVHCDDSVPETADCVVGNISSSASIFSDEPVTPYQTKFANLHILPAYSSALNLIEGVHRSQVVKQVFNKYKEWKNSKEVLNKYDFIIVDHAPTKTKVGDATLSESDGLIIPVQTKASDINGMKVMLQLWTQINQARTLSNPLQLLGILVNNYDGRRSAEKIILGDIRNNAVASKYLIPEIIPSSTYFLEKSLERSVTQNGTVFDLPDSSQVKTKMKTVCEYIYNKVK